MRSLYAQVMVAVFLGIIMGHFWPELANSLKPLGDGFIKLIKMMIGPVIFTTVVLGIVHVEHGKDISRVGLKAFIYFELVSTLALVIGLIVVNLLQPGAGMNIDPSRLSLDSIQSYLHKAEHQNIAEFLLHIIPSNIVSAFANGELLPILFIAILCGTALWSIKERVGLLIDLIDQVQELNFKLIGFIMKLAPIGAFGAMAYTIGAFGIGSLWALSHLMLCFYVTCIAFIFLVLGSMMRLYDLSLWALLRAIKDELWLVLGTSSSESALPSLMRQLTRHGCHKSVVGLVVPSGYSFNLDGTSIYFTMAAIFIAQAMNIELTIAQQLSLLAILLITSKGAAGVTGSGFITLAATLSAFHTVPVEGMVLLLGIDRFMSEGRAITNLIGNAVATVIIAKSEGKLELDSPLRCPFK